MSLIEADKIVQIWGKYLEFASGKIGLFFGTKIPESFLPFPKDTLIEALNTVAAHHHEAGNEQGVKLIQETAALLIMYVDDEEAVLQASKSFNDPKWRKAFLPVIKKFQEDWIKTQ